MKNLKSIGNIAVVNIQGNASFLEMELGKTTAYLDFNIKKIPVDIFELVKWISEPQP